MGKRQSADVVDADETRLGGGVSGAVAAHPAQPAVVLLLGAALWFVRASGLLAELDEPGWGYALAGVNLVGAALLVLNAGPVKRLAQACAALCLGAAAYLAGGELWSAFHLLFVSHSAIVLFMVAGDPSRARRNIGLGMGLLASAALAVVSLGGARVRGTSLVELSAPSQGFSLWAPEGFSALAREQMLPHLHLPLESRRSRSFGFGNRLRRVYGALTLDSSPEVQLIGGCQEHLRALGGTQAAAPLAAPAPDGLGVEALVYELKTTSGATGRLSCGLLADGRLAALAVVAQDEDPRAGAEAFELIAEHLSIRAGLE